MTKIAVGQCQRMKQIMNGSDLWIGANNASAIVRLASTSGVPPHHSESSRFTLMAKGQKGWRSTQLEQAKDVMTTATSKQL